MKIPAGEANIASVMIGGMRNFLLFAMLAAFLSTLAGCTRDLYNATNIAVTPYIYKEMKGGREVYRMSMKTSSVWVDPVGARIVGFSRSDRAQMNMKRDESTDEVIFVENKAMVLNEYHYFDGEIAMTLTPEAPKLALAKYWLSYTNIGQMTFVCQAVDGWQVTRDFRMMDNGALYVTTTLQNRGHSARDVTVKVGLGAPDTAMVVDGKAVALTVAKDREVLMRLMVPTPSEDDYMQFNAETPTGVNSVVDKGVKYSPEVMAKMNIVTGDEAKAYDGFVIGPVGLPVPGQKTWTVKWIVTVEGN
jgi:hypothetical protein